MRKLGADSGAWISYLVAGRQSERKMRGSESSSQSDGWEEGDPRAFAAHPDQGNPVRISVDSRGGGLPSLPE